MLKLTNAVLHVDSVRYENYRSAVTSRLNYYEWICNPHFHLFLKPVKKYFSKFAQFFMIFVQEFGKLIQATYFQGIRSFCIFVMRLHIFSNSRDCKFNVILCSMLAHVA